MAKGKLRLKRTPAEEASRQWRKTQKAARKAAKRRLADDGEDPYDDDHGYGSSKRRRTQDSLGGYDDSDSEYGPQPAPSSSTAGSHRAHKPDYDRIQAEIEEMRFREKLQEAMGDDERLDSVEASMNSYTHIPRRWRGGGMDRMDDELGIDPRYMEEEDYAEWVREGMWRKKHAAEHEESMRREAERKARREREKALREETRRLELAAEEERRKRRSQKERLQAAEARESYDARWKELLAPNSTAHAEGTLRFGDVPWPVMPSFSSRRDERPVVTLEDLTAEAISAFLLPPSDDADLEDRDAAKKDRKEKLRETMLRFHPDKFEGRIMRLVRDSEKELVKEAVGVVARTLNTLMGEGK
ncbi:hypothetical protein OH77DRAFT_1015004 [Trametes cingulata]|nr:hypothetical protein OH77DRAFT_1015004 [Trametes cingulata]